MASKIYKNFHLQCIIFTKYRHEYRINVYLYFQFYKETRKITFISHFDQNKTGKKQQ